MALWLSGFMSWLQMVSNAIIYLFLFLLDISLFKWFFMVPGNQGMMMVIYNGAILHDSGVYRPYIDQHQSLKRTYIPNRPVMAFRACFRMYLDGVLGSSIFEKTIFEFLCGSRYFFAIAIRYRVKPLLPLHSCSESHHE